MSHKPSVVFFGNEKIATGVTKSDLPTLHLLVDKGYQIDAIFTPQKRTSSRNKRQFEVIKFAQKYKIPIYTEYTQDELLNILDKLPASIAILVAYGRIIPQSIIDHFEHGIINIHPSLLPQYRGSTPIETAILDGVDVTGVSIMQLVDKMDAGPVYAQKKINISDNETKEALSNRLSLLGANLLIENMEFIINKDLQPRSQKNNPSICNKISKEDGNIDTTKSAQQILREIRAYSGWPKSHLRHKHTDLIVLSARLSEIVLDTHKLSIVDNKLILQCNKSSLEITSIQIPGKKPMDAASFINGYKNII